MLEIPLGTIAAVWIVITGLTAALILYRQVLGMKHGDYLMLDPGKAEILEERRRTGERIDRLTTYAKGLGFISGALFVFMAGIWVYRGLYGGI